MAELLFVTMDAGGNVPPMLGIAAAAARAGHSVRVLGHARLREAVAGYGLELVAYRGIRAWDATREQSVLRWAAMLNDRGLGEAVRSECADRRPDVAVVDCMLAPAHAAIDEAGIARVVLTHTFKAFYDGLYRRTSGPVARLHGYRLAEQWRTARLDLVATDASLDPAARSGPAGNARWIGVVGATAGTPSTPSPGLPLVLVSLSTNGFPGQRRTIERVMAALSGLPVRALVTVGGVFDPGSFTPPPNVAVESYVDHASVLPECALVISHGGHSTAFRALAHAVPLVLIPTSRMTDQPLIARTLAGAGAAAALRRSASPATIAATVREVLSDPRYRAAAAAIGARLRSTDAADVAVELLTEVAVGTGGRR